MNNADLLTSEKKDHFEQSPQDLINITISLTSSNKPEIIKASSKITDFFALKNISFKKIVPGKKIGEITTRKSPCGQGTATFSKYQIRVYTQIFKYEGEHESITQLVGQLENIDAKADFSLSN